MPRPAVTRPTRLLILTAMGVALLATAMARGNDQLPPAPSSVETRPADSELAGTGILILDSRDSLPLVKRLLQEFLIETGGDITFDSRQSEIESEVDMLFADDGSASSVLPRISFRFGQEDEANMVAGFLKASDYFLRSNEVCPGNCRFRDLDHDSDHVHIHLTRAAGGEGDTVLAFRFDRREDASGRRLDYDLARNQELRREWLMRYSLLPDEVPDDTPDASSTETAENDPPSHDRSSPATRLFGTRVVVGNPVRSDNR